MSDLKKRFNEILADLEKNIKNKEDLEYIKAQVYNISLLFLDELDKVAEMNVGRLNMLLDKEKELNKRISTMEKTMKNIEEEMFISEDCDFEIQCPYCNAEFVEDFTNGFKHEVKCPECDNVIELDWQEDGECNCGHEDSCNGECFFDDDDEEDSDENEDDM